MQNKISLFVATPLYDHPTAEYTQSMFQFVKWCYEKTYSNKIVFKRSPYVTRARNILVDMFLESDCTHLLFIDADIKFNPEIIEKLLHEDKEVICIPYPIKNFNLGHTDFPVIFKKDIIINKNCIEIAAGPTGFMMFKREVFNKMISFYGDKMKLKNKYNLKNLYNFFDNMHIPDEQSWYGDDFAFCKRWTSMGGKVFAYLNTEITHVGMYHYTGSFGGNFIYE